MKDIKEFIINESGDPAWEGAWDAMYCDSNPELYINSVLDGIEYGLKEATFCKNKKEWKKFAEYLKKYKTI